MDYDYGRGIVDRQPQILTHFPNDNSKRIDYVVAYKYDRKHDHQQPVAANGGGQQQQQHSIDVDSDARRERDEFEEREDLRRKFVLKLQEEGFDVEFLRRNHSDYVSVYMLLHCNVERLLKEAERTKLEMRLNNTHFEYDDTDYVEVQWVKSIKDFLLRRKPLKKDNTGNIITAPYDSSIRYLFAGCDEKSVQEGEGPFTTAVRSFLVDHILKNLVIEQKRDETSNHNSQHHYRGLVHDVKHLKFSNNLQFEDKIGLPYLISENVFDDGFILHDQTNHYFHIIDMVRQARQKAAAVIGNENEKPKKKKSGNDDESSSSDDDLSDDETARRKEEAIENQEYLSESSDNRRTLHNTWAKLTNIFRSQPLYLVRSYFGESIAFYFAWVGTFTFMLLISSAIGTGFFIYGIILSANTNYTLNVTQNATAIQNFFIRFTKNRASVYGSYYISVFANAFDNNSTPYFALIISIWGAFFAEFWSRENARLAFEWDVIKYESDEPDLPEYTRRMKLLKERMATSSEIVKYFLIHQRKIKTIISYFILIFMVLVVCLDIAAVALFRIYIKLKAFPTDTTLQIIIGDVGSTVINSILILILNFIYKIIVKKFTQWENYRTKTEYEDALIYKLFLFEFANSYGSLFYLAFFRQIYYPNGMFNLGPEYQDSCDENNCMALLTTQLLVVLLINPLPLFLSDVVWPLVGLMLKKLRSKYENNKPAIFNREKKRHSASLKQDRLRRLNEKLVLRYARIEKSKPKSDSAIASEYTQKVILYGYLMLFACSFTLAPLILLLINVFDLRVDGLRLLWLFRRPVAYRAQDIGAWFYIIRFLNVVGIVSNAFIIAFTSNWSTTFLQDKLENRLLFVLVFEHVVFIIWLLITYSYSGIPSSVKFKMRTETKLVREAIDAFRTIKQESSIMGMRARMGVSMANVAAGAGYNNGSAVDIRRREKTQRYEEDSRGGRVSRDRPSAEASSSLKEADSLGVMIKPNVIVDESMSNNNSSDDLQIGSANRNKRRNNKKKHVKNFQILPIDHD